MIDEEENFIPQY